MKGKSPSHSLSCKHGCTGIRLGTPNIRSAKLTEDFGLALLKPHFQGPKKFAITLSSDPHQRKMYSLAASVRTVFLFPIFLQNPAEI